MDSHDVAWGTTFHAPGVAGVDFDEIASRFGAETSHDRRTLSNSHAANPDMMAGPAVTGNLPETLGALLRLLRCEAGLTLDQVASAVGVKKPSVWAWETGRNNPTREKWHVIANVLGVAPQVLAHAAKAEGRNKAALSRLQVDEVDRAAMLTAGREMIANAYGVTPSAVRITLEI